MEDEERVLDFVLRKICMFSLKNYHSWGVGGGGGGSEICFKCSKLIQLVTEEFMQSLNMKALLHLTDSGGYVQFTLKFKV